MSELADGGSLRLHNKGRFARGASWRRLADALFLTEPLWVMASVLVVYLTVVLEVSRQWMAAGLAVALLPFALRLWQYRRLTRHTPFDLPIMLLLAGAGLGAWVSPKGEASLESWLSLVAIICLYYTIVNYPRPRLLIKWGSVVGFLLACAIIVFTFSGSSYASSPNWVNSWLFDVGASLPSLPQPGNYGAPLSLDTHGTALTLVVAAAICLGVALFGRGWALRGAVLLSSILFIGITFANTNQSLLRLFSGESLRGRMVVWQRTLDLMNGPQHITGLGLGYWPWAYNDGAVRAGFTHPHNAYVQLYSDTGVIGLLALAVALMVSARLVWKMLRQRREHPYVGLAVGIVIAMVVTLTVGVVEAAPTGIPVVAKETYHYVISPAAFLLGGMLVVLHRLGLESPGKQAKGED